MGGDFAFRSWNYIKASFYLDPVAENNDDGCTDTGCSISLMNKIFLKDRRPDVNVSKMASPLRVRSVGPSKHVTSENVTIPIYMPDVDKAGDKVLRYLRRELHLLEDLCANVLIGC